MIPAAPLKLAPYRTTLRSSRAHSAGNDTPIVSSAMPPRRFAFATSGTVNLQYRDTDAEVPLETLTDVAWLPKAGNGTLSVITTFPTLLTSSIVAARGWLARLTMLQETLWVVPFGGMRTARVTSTAASASPPSVPTSNPTASV